MNLIENYTQNEAVIESLEKETRANRATVLAVDDSEMMRMLLESTLAQSPYNLVLAEDGVDGVAKFKANEIDIVVTDINMPEMDGITLIKEIRELDGEVPILTLTTESEEALKQAGARAGANGWIVKPMYPQQFLDLLEQIIGAPRG